MEGAINENPDLPGFIGFFKPNYPVGIADNTQANSFMQIPMFERSFVPFMVIMDRQGVIRFQHTGSDVSYFTDDVGKQAANIRGEVEQLLKEPPPKAAHKTAAKKK